MKKIAVMATVLMAVAVSAFAKVETVYDFQHDAVIYNTSKKSTGIDAITTLDFYKTVTKANAAYYHVVARIYGVTKDFKPTGKALLVVDNEMLDLQAVPFNHYAMSNDFDPKMTMLDYALPENLVSKLRNHQSQIGLQVFFDGEKPRILTLDKKGNEELRLITNLKFADYEGVKKGTIKRAQFKGEKDLF
ncbi:MAG: hypothetical protein KBS60_07745 [Phascolarctobacterium sp.]|nr:hypothetical protein [Candidatus Phascolarctobacterium caballi]